MLLQYITNENSPHSVTEQIKAVIAGGGKWIQIRMKHASDEEISRVVEEIKPLCEQEEVFLIMNDRVELAKEVNVGGVHLGKDDMPPSKARLMLGPAAVIGVTANDIDDIKSVKSLDIDYIGIGPYKHTDTKERLAPILGKEGLEKLCDYMQTDEINIAHVAIGGITLDDVEDVMATGVNGIAVSSAIAMADDMKIATEQFIAKLKPYIKADLDMKIAD